MANQKNPRETGESGISKEMMLKAYAEELKAEAELMRDMMDISEKDKQREREQKERLGLDDLKKEEPGLFREAAKQLTDFVLKSDEAKEMQAKHSFGKN